MLFLELICLFILLFCLQNAKMVTIYWFYLTLSNLDLTRGMQVVLSLDSTKVTGVVGFVLSLSAKLYTKYVLLE